MAPVLTIFIALILGAARCPPSAVEPDVQPEPSQPEPGEPEGVDAGDPDGGAEPDPQPTPEPNPSTPEPCVPSPGGVPSDAESLEAFTDTGITDYFNSCASCHINGGTPAGTGQGWGPDGDTTAQGWYNAAVATYDRNVAADANVTPEGTDLYRTTANAHFGNQPNPTIAQDVVDWITYSTTEAPPVVCDEPEPDPPEPDPEPIDAGPPDAGPPPVEPDPEPDGIPGVPYAVEFVTNPFTIPRDTCVPFVTTVRLVDNQGTEVDATEAVRVALTATPGVVTFWRDTGCVTGLTDDVDFAIGESRKSFRWKGSVAGEITMTARPNPSSGLLTATQVHNISD